MKVIFFGTSQFAVPSLKALHKSEGFDIVAVITQPDKPAGRKQKPLPSPVKVEAEKLGLKILQPESLKDFKPEIPEADVFVVASYGKFIPKEILDLPKYGTLNIHPSLLPKYRGPSPVQAAILNGDRETGVAIIKLDEEMDHGPILGKVKYQILNDKITFEELYDELSKLGADLLIEILPKYISGEISPAPQDHDAATYTKIITKDDARIDWQKSAKEIDQMVRAYHRWPNAWTTLDDKRLKIFSATPLPQKSSTKVGEISVENKNIIVACGADSSLQIEELHIEGSKKMNAASFLNGYKDLSGKALK